MLVTVVRGERRVRIELGRRMQSYVSYAEARAIIDEAMAPAVRSGDFAGGLEAGLRRLMAQGRRFTGNPWATAHGVRAAALGR